LREATNTKKTPNERIILKRKEKREAKKRNNYQQVSKLPLFPRWFRRKGLIIAWNKANEGRQLVTAVLEYPA